MGKDRISWFRCIILVRATIEMGQPSPPLHKLSPMSILRIKYCRYNLLQYSMRLKLITSKSSMSLPISVNENTVIHNMCASGTVTLHEMQKEINLSYSYDNGCHSRHKSKLLQHIGTVCKQTTKGVDVWTLQGNNYANLKTIQSSNMQWHISAK